ncbi:MAG TPA: PqqD family protein [Acidimicrobiia bacterium]|jgi:hypothetical protein
MPRTRVVSQQLTRSPQTVWRRGAFGIVLFPPRGDDPLTLAGTGAAVWDALATPASESELVDRLGRQFAADTDRVRTDVKPLLEQLVDLGAVAVGDK